MILLTWLKGILGKYWMLHMTLLKNMMKKLMNIIMKIVQMVAGVGNNNLKIKTESMVLKKGSTGPEVEELQKILG